MWCLLFIVSASRAGQTLIACRQIQKETENIFYKKNAFAYQWHVFPIVARQKLFMSGRDTFSRFCRGHGRNTFLSGRKTILALHDKKNFDERTPPTSESGSHCIQVS